MIAFVDLMQQIESRPEMMLGHADFLRFAAFVDGLTYRDQTATAGLAFSRWIWQCYHPGDTDVACPWWRTMEVLADEQSWDMGGRAMISRATDLLVDWDAQGRPAT